MELSLKNIHIDGINFRVYDSEEGNPVLFFIHYWGGSSQTWNLVLAELTAHFRCITMDLRGWGESDKHATEYSLEAQADDVLAVIKSLELTTYTLVGHSMGGKIAQIIASRQPTGLQHLILVAPAPPTAMNVPLEQREMMLASYQSREGVEQAINILAKRPLSHHLREQIIIDTLQGAPDAKRAWTKRGMLTDISGTVGGINVPTTVVVGDKDQVEKEDVLRRELASRVKDCEVVVLAGVGHLSPLEAPAELAAVIAKAAHRV